MKVSVLIPVYNGARTIRATLESVLNQSLSPNEILVLNDGSTDDTASIISSCGPRVTLMSVMNGGVARARNILCRRAEGDLLAFLDSDDIWHPAYLEAQKEVFEKHPNAVASYTGHLNFYGDQDYQWDHDDASGTSDSELIAPLDYLIRYNRKTGDFGSMSYCCVRRAAVSSLGENLFCVDSVEDSYLSFQLALLGPVVYTPTQLVAYRITQNSISADHLKTYPRWLSVFELMVPRYQMSGNPQLIRAFKQAFASKRRTYSKMLMAANRVQDARTQLRCSLQSSIDPTSIAKSLAMLTATYLPLSLQPHWWSGERRTVPTS